MIIQRLFSKLGGIKKGLEVNKAATGFANKKLARKGYKAAKETATSTGQNTNIVTGKDGSYYIQKHYKFQSRPDTKHSRPKAEQKELDGFKRGKTRGPKEDDPKLNPPKRKVTGKPWTRGIYHEKEKPGKNIRTKTDFTDGSGRVKINSPKIPGLFKNKK